MKLRRHPTANVRLPGAPGAVALGAGRGGVATVNRVAHLPGLVQIRLADDMSVPDGDAVAALVDRLRADQTVAMVRTAALYPAAADEFQAMGFDVTDSLALLRADLDDPAVHPLVRRRGGAGRPARGTVRLRRRDLVPAATIDRAAFGKRWAHDADDLGQVRTATPRYRARAVPATRRGHRRRGRIVAFAMSGASADSGYLQRLAVEPAGQRRGHATTLVADALAWMRRQRLADCVVNTSVTNEAALALYASLGFRRTGEHLEVLELDVG